MPGGLELTLRRRVVVVLNARDHQEKVSSAAETLRLVGEGFQSERLEL